MVVTLEAMTVPPLIGPPCRLFQDNEGRIYNTERAERSAEGAEKSLLRPAVAVGWYRSKRRLLAWTTRT